MNIKDVKLAPMSYWVKSEKPTEYHDDNGTYYELWGDTLAVVANKEGKLELTNVSGRK